MDSIACEGRDIEAGTATREVAQTGHRAMVKKCGTPSSARRVKRGWWVLAAGVIATTMAGGVARATEAGLFAGPLGGSDIRSAYLPPAPGLYAAGVGILGAYNVLTGNNGNKSPLDAYYHAELAGIAGTYVYPWQLDGGSLATSINQGYLFTHQRVGSRQQVNNGFTDTYSDLLIWSKRLGRFSDADGSASPDAPKPPYGLTVAAAYSMVFPDGRYNVHDLAVQGHNYYVFIPNFAVTCLTGPRYSFGNGTEISARFYYDVPTVNTANSYQSGQVFDVDWAVTQRFNGLQLGVTGNYARQTTPDLLRGRSTAGGNFLERATVGPIVAVDIPSIKATLKAKILWDVVDRNTFGDRIAATISLAFKVF